MNYIVKRYIIEKYSVNANNTEAAIRLSKSVTDPYDITIKKTTVVRDKR
ncbi:MAG: hypothetical protein J7L15_00325 [Clostridiales bacterium]|nr:hypothetical protein [Clostridiales bacterium]